MFFLSKETDLLTGVKEEEIANILCFVQKDRRTLGESWVRVIKKKDEGNRSTSGIPVATISTPEDDGSEENDTEKTKSNSMVCE